MNTKTTIGGITIEQGSGNVYADLGLPDAEAMLVKAELARQIAQIIRSRHLTQQQAAAILGVTQPKLSELLRGRFRGISQTKMIEGLNRLGRDVNIVVHKAGCRAVGRTQVMVAWYDPSSNSAERFKQPVQRNDWVAASGIAKVTRNDEVFMVAENESTLLPLGAVHRLRNPGRIPLELIEVQSGSYLGEDDIVRLEDVYGRAWGLPAMGRSTNKHGRCADWACRAVNADPRRCSAGAHDFIAREHST